MSESAVGIGLPVLNGERFLSRAIESVLAQTHQNWQLLVSDNGSVDSTLHIAQSYAERDPRIRVRRNERNEGAVANFAAVFRETSGPFFMWLAHDDWIAPSYIERLVTVLEESPDFVLAFAGQNVVDDNGLPFRTRTEPIDQAASARSRTRFHAIQWHLQDPTAPVFGVMRRAALEKTGLIRNSYEPDRVLIGELSLLGRIHQDPELLFYHYGPPGHTNRDEWAWLNPMNPGRPMITGLPIVGHQWNAVWRGDFGVIEKLAMAADLLSASLITRTAGKIRAIRRQMRSKPESAPSRGLVD